MWRACGCLMDRKHEHGFGWQQDALFSQQWENQAQQHHAYVVWGARSCRGLSCHSQPVFTDLLEFSFKPSLKSFYTFSWACSVTIDGCLYGSLLLSIYQLIYLLCMLGVVWCTWTLMNLDGGLMLSLGCKEHVQKWKTKPRYSSIAAISGCDSIHLSILSNVYWSKYNTFKIMQ